MKRRVLAYPLSVISLVLIFLALPANAFANKNATYSSELPRAVQSAVNSVVDIEYVDNSGVTVQKSSGVKISPELTLSVGHEFLQNGPMQNASDKSLCRNLFLYSFGDKNSNQSTDSSIIATYTNTDSSNPDISLIKTEGDPQFKKLPTAVISSQTNINTQVYLANYEPDIKSIDRNPNAQANTFDQSTKYTFPAIYSGIVLDTNGGRYSIATGVKSYGIGIPDNESRPGASGGPVFNQEGQLIGVTVSIDSQTMTPQEIKSIYNIDLSGLSTNSQFQIEEVQPINIELIQQYTQLINNPSLVNNISPESTSTCRSDYPEVQHSKTSVFFSELNTKTSNIFSFIKNSI